MSISSDFLFTYNLAVTDDQKRHRLALIPLTCDCVCANRMHYQ